jgi:8-oxo-dGTP pyrophosphatase MutT (NUDIX family)
MTEPNAACVLLFHPTKHLVLVELHPDGLGLPGGRREASDASSLACASRELFEETGIVLLGAASILVYSAGPHTCEAFLATRWEDRRERPIATHDDTLRSRRCAWVDAEEIIGSSGRFPKYCARMFARLAGRTVGYGLDELVVEERAGCCELNDRGKPCECPAPKG